MRALMLLLVDVQVRMTGMGIRRVCPDELEWVIRLLSVHSRCRRPFDCCLVIRCCE